MMETSVLSETLEEQTLADVLRDGLFVDGDWVETKDQDPDGEVRLIQLADIGDGVFRDRSARFLTTAKASELGCTFLQAGDVLVARMPEPIGRACIFPGVEQQAVTAVDICVLRPNPDRVRAEWLVNAINSPGFRSSMQRFVRGTTRQRISRRNLGSLPLRVPPVDAQLRLATALRRVESIRGRASDHVGAGSRAIHNYRRAVLTAACSGGLTADWRDEHPHQPTALNPLDEHRKGESSKRSRALEEFSTADLPELPDTWVWAPLAAVSESVLGKMLDKEKNRGEPRPYLRNINVRWRAFDLADVQEMRFEPGEEGRYGLRKGDVLVCEGGEPGRAAVWRDEQPDMRFQKALHRVRCDERLLPEWLVDIFQAHAASGLLSTYLTGSGIAHLTGVSLARVAIPLPPIAEQVEVVHRVERHLALADRTQRRLEAVGRAIHRSSRAVLARAFRAELVDEMEVLALASE